MILNIEIRTLPSKVLIGMKQAMSISKNSTGPLFRSFRPKRHQIPNLIDDATWDLRVYPGDYFSEFDPSKTFIKWALAEVSATGTLPGDMETFQIQGGLYAVFHYKGLCSDPKVFQWIFSEWLPQSGYALDDRPHFEILTGKTRLNDPESEEEIWVPIKPQ